MIDVNKLSREASRVFGGTWEVTEGPGLGLGYSFIIMTDGRRYSCGISCDYNTLQQKNPLTGNWNSVTAEVRTFNTSGAMIDYWKRVVELNCGLDGDGKRKALVWLKERLQ